jgi:syntaxin 1B/2/3
MTTALMSDKYNDQLHEQLREVILHNCDETNNQSLLVKDITLFENKIDVHFNNIDILTRQVERTSEDEKKTNRDDVRKQMYDNLLLLSKDFYINATQIKQLINTIQNLHVSESIKINLTNRYNTKLSINFQDFLKEVEETKNTFHEHDKQNLKRLLSNKSIIFNLSEEKLNTIVEYGQTDYFIQQLSTSNDLEEACKHIEERHLEILKIETNVKELYELFKDLSILVNLQGESLNNIEEHIKKAKDYSEEGEVELIKGEQYQKKAKCTSKCLCLSISIIMLIIMIGLLIPRLLHAY